MNQPLTIGARWWRYGTAVVCRPASHYIATISITLVVLGFCFFFFGSAYAIAHRDKVRYGPLAYFVGPIMLVSFLFFLGLKPSIASSTSVMYADDEYGSGNARKAQIIRVAGVALFGLGGLFLGISLAFFGWFDPGLNPIPSCYNITTMAPPTPSPSPTPSWFPSPTTRIPVDSRPNSFLPAQMLLAQVICIALGIIFAWLTVVFQEQEDRIRAGMSATDDEDPDNARL